MNAYALTQAVPLDAWFQAMRCWLLTLLASFLDALERAHRPRADDGAWRSCMRAAVRAIFIEMREGVADAEREVARALLVAAFAEVIARRRACGPPRPSMVRFDQARARHRFEARLLKPLLKSWRRALRRERGEGRLAARVRRLAATLADPARAIDRLVGRLIRLKRCTTWRTVRVASPSPPVSHALAPRGADTS